MNDTNTIEIPASKTRSPNDPQVHAIIKRWTEGGRSHRLVARVRWDDDCGNGHNTFSVTGDLYVDGRWESGGCLHDLIAERVPEVAHAIPFHLCSPKGPMHYEANVIYHAGDRDHHGLRKGERKPLLRGGVEPVYEWRTKDGKLPHQAVPGMSHVEPDAEPITFYPTQKMWVGVGKERELDRARRCAVWPEATDAELMAEPEELREALRARLPGLIRRLHEVVTGHPFHFEW